MGTYTTNYNLFMPTVGEQGWGTLVNGNFTTIDTTMKSLNNRIGTLETETDMIEERVTVLENKPCAVPIYIRLTTTPNDFGVLIPANTLSSAILNLPGYAIINPEDTESVTVNVLPSNGNSGYYTTIYAKNILTGTTRQLGRYEGSSMSYNNTNTYIYTIKLYETVYTSGARSNSIVRSAVYAASP